MTERLLTTAELRYALTASAAEWPLLPSWQRTDLAEVLAAANELHFTFHPEAAEIREVFGQSIPVRQLRLLYPEAPKLQQVLVYTRWLARLSATDLAAIRQRLDTLMPTGTQSLHDLLDPLTLGEEGRRMNSVLGGQSEVALMRAYTLQSRLERSLLAERRTLDLLIDAGSQAFFWLENHAEFRIQGQINHVRLARELIVLMVEYGVATAALSGASQEVRA